jgi:O-Methyltransferase involved in polyketide biosynthesis
MHLKGEKETLFITLYAKAQDYRSDRPILHDHWADEMTRTVDYDFSEIARENNTITVVRTKELDDVVDDFISKHHHAVVVHLGCGLDARILRIAAPPTITWFDVDYAEVIELRKTLFPPRNGYFMIGSSVTEPGWLKEIPVNRPALILAEGLVEYLSEEKMHRLLMQITDHFQYGHIAFDIMNSFAIKLVKDKLQTVMGVTPSWAVDDVRQIDELNPRLKRIDSLALIRSRYIKKLPILTRLSLGICSIFPAFRNMMRIVQYEFYQTR